MKWFLVITSICHAVWCRALPPPQNLQFIQLSVIVLTLLITIWDKNALGVILKLGLRSYRRTVPSVTLCIVPRNSRNLDGLLDLIESGTLCTSIWKFNGKIDLIYIVQQLLFFLLQCQLNMGYKYCCSLSE